MVPLTKETIYRVQEVFNQTTTILTVLTELICSLFTESELL